MYLVPIEEKEEFRNKPQQFSKTNLPENFKEKIGEYFCPMFCEGDKTYNSDIGCPVCHMHLEEITDDLIQNSKKHDRGNAHNHTHHPVPSNGISENHAGKYYCPMFCEGDKAVSYTHLDVYKRQEYIIITKNISNFFILLKFWFN